MKLSLLALSVAALTWLALAGQAQTRPRCDGPFSLDGSLRARYCGSEYLAKVAAEYGVHVTGQQLRDHFSVFLTTCRRVDSDIRVDLICRQGSFGNPLLCDAFGCD